MPPASQSLKVEISTLCGGSLIQRGEALKKNVWEQPPPNVKNLKESRKMRLN